MQCPNCNNIIPDTANVCGYCGYQLKKAVSPTPPVTRAGRQPRKEISGWVWVFIAAIALTGLGVGSFFLWNIYKMTTPQVPQSQVIVVVTSTEPTATSSPIPSPTATATAIPTLKPIVPSPVVQTINRCGLFRSIKMSVIYLDWRAGTPLMFYIKMPGGVPGLEKKISDDSRPWLYSVKIGDETTKNCSPIEGYKERLYCAINLPSAYAKSYRSFDLFVNECNQSVFTNSMNDLPAFAGGGGGGSGGSSSCGGAPSQNDAPAVQSWCSCMGGAYYVLLPAGFPPQGYCTLP